MNVGMYCTRKKIYKKSVIRPPNLQSPPSGPMSQGSITQVGTYILVGTYLYLVNLHRTSEERNEYIGSDRDLKQMETVLILPRKFRYKILTDRNCVLPDVAPVNVEEIYGGLVGECAALNPVDGDTAERDVVHQEPGESVVLDLVHCAVLHQDASATHREKY
jgi:hypothetical protein